MRLFANCCCLFFFLSATALVENTALAKKIENKNGSVWSIKRSEGVYNLIYINPKGRQYSNREIIPSDLSFSDVFFDMMPNDNIKLVLEYPKDSYIFEFSTGENPYVLSACKSIKLPSSDEQQAIAIMTLCSVHERVKNTSLSDINTDNLLAPENLMLVGKVKTLISSNKAFFYDERNSRMKNNPYLISGDKVDVLEYKNSMLKISYGTKKNRTAWIDFDDVL